MSVAEIDFGHSRSSIAALVPLPAETARAPMPVPTRPSAAFKAQLVAFLPDLQRWARHLSAHASDARDLVQDTVRRALETCEQFHAGTDLRAWLGCILRNLHRDRMRRRWRETPLEDDRVAWPAPPIERPELWTAVSDDDLQVAMAALPETYRTPYLLHTVDGLSYTEISDLVGIPSGTVGTRIHRARLLLRRFLTHRLDQRAAA
jgi:RNA polymerase sigma-70 factor (ECF subfamily)